MPTVTFEGRVIPEAVNLTVDSPLSVGWEEGDFACRFNIEIRNSKIKVLCEVERFDKGAHLTMLFTRALDAVRAPVNLVAFASGYGAMAVLDTLTEPDGTTTAVVLRDPPLAELCTAFQTDGDFQKALEIVIAEPSLNFALRDLVGAISTTHEIPNSCGRAVETLRSLMVPAGADRKVGWSELQQKLNVTETYLKLITDHSKPPRHGDHVYVPGAVTRVIADRSWTLMNRYLEYRKRGGQQLSLDDFPLLTG